MADVILYSGHNTSDIDYCRDPRMDITTPVGKQCLSRQQCCYTNLLPAIPLVTSVEHEKSFRSIGMGAQANQ